MIIKFAINTYDSIEVAEAFRVLEALTTPRPAPALTTATQSNDKALFAAQAAPLLEEDVLVLTDGDAAPAEPETATIHEITPPPAASESDAFAAMQAAVASGVQLPAIVALLNERKVSRVNQLSPDDRATFVAAIKNLGGAS